MSSQLLNTPLSIGHLTLPNRLIQAPLAGYSCAPFRMITQSYGNPAFTCTEMISGHDLAHRQEGPRRYLWRDPEERIVCYQISGQDPDKLAMATAKVSRAGADIVDLNCGCPVKKIRSKKQGSKLLADPEHIARLVKTMKANTDAVVSIKIRVGEPLHDSNDIAIAQAAEAAGVDFITVHGRHWTERYDVPVRPEPIARVVESVSIPVFANGDVSDVASAIALQQQTQAAGLMIARASVGYPWLFQHILNPETFTRPSYQLIGDVFKQHIQRLIELDGEKLAILQSRKLAKYYARFLPKRTEFVEASQIAEQQQQQIALIDQYFA